MLRGRSLRRSVSSLTGGLCAVQGGLDSTHLTSRNQRLERGARVRYRQCPWHPQHSNSNSRQAAAVAGSAGVRKQQQQKQACKKRQKQEEVRVRYGRSAAAKPASQSAAATAASTERVELAGDSLAADAATPAHQQPCRRWREAVMFHSAQT